MFFPNSDSSSVVAKGPVDSNSTDNTHSLRFLSMAFRSVSYLFTVMLSGAETASKKWGG